MGDLFEGLSEHMMDAVFEYEGIDIPDRANFIKSDKMEFRQEDTLTIKDHLITYDSPFIRPEMHEHSGEEVRVEYVIPGLNSYTVFENDHLWHAGLIEDTSDEVPRHKEFSMDDIHFGDAFLLRFDLENHKQYGEDIFINPMTHAFGKPLIVTNYSSGFGKIQANGYRFTFTPEMIARKIEPNWKKDFRADYKKGDLVVATSNFEILDQLKELGIQDNAFEINGLDISDGEYRIGNVTWSKDVGIRPATEYEKEKHQRQKENFPYSVGDTVTVDPVLMEKYKNIENCIELSREEYELEVINISVGSQLVALEYEGIFFWYPINR